jgi:hypothetical protein
MRNVIAFVVALGIVIAIFWFTRPDDAPVTATPVVASGSAPPAAQAPKIDTSKVRRLDKATRKQLGEQIAAAREKARAAAATSSTTGSGPPPALPDDELQLEEVSAALQDRLQETVSLLADCYGAHPTVHEATANMTLTSDPELGTVIDTEEITGADGKPLAAALDTCLRDTIDSLALPPLGPTGGKLPTKFSFRFD